jgi:hypothetical protein
LHEEIRRRLRLRYVAAGGARGDLEPFRIPHFPINGRYRSPLSTTNRFSSTATVALFIYIHTYIENETIQKSTEKGTNIHNNSKGGSNAGF